MIPTHPVAQWALALVASLTLALGLDALAVPAAFLVGPMVAGIALALGGAAIRPPRPAFLAGQALIGCAVARALTFQVLASIAQSWPAMFAAVFATVAVSAGVGWLLVRFGSLPGSTAAWGTSPGGASAMVAMAQEFGADPVAVAMMQYLRVVLVVLAASLVSGFMLGPGHPPAGDAAALRAEAPLDPIALAETLAVAALAAWAGLRLKVPAGALLAPMGVVAVLQGFGLLAVTLPRPLLLAGYGVIGLSIGLRFRRDLLRRTLRVLPEMLASALVLVALCGGLAWALVRFVHTDALTAYLATSPGGLDSVAIIAASSSADVPFVLALQTLRVLVVLVTGPALAKLLSRAAR